MRTEIHNKDFQNWIKGVLALNTTRDALLVTLREKIGSFVLKYEKSDIQKFANCLEKNNTKPLKEKKLPGQRNKKKKKKKKEKEKRTYTCAHEQCKKLFDIFVDKHNKIKKEKFEWNLECNGENTNEENRVGENTNEHEITEENTNEEKRVEQNTGEHEITEDNTNEENRVEQNTNEQEITEDNTNEENRVEKNTNEHEITEEDTNEKNRVEKNTNEHEITEDNTNAENRVEKNTNEHEITEDNTNEENRDGENTNEEETETLWPISRLYMYDEVKYVAKYKGLDDLDISNLINIMDSCSICKVDGDTELYTKVLAFRNDMMHNPDNKITKQYFQEKLKEASLLIQHLRTGDLKPCTSQRLEDAVQYLKNLGEKEFQFSFPFEEYQRVFKEAVKAKQILEDMVTSEPNQEVLKHLHETFKTITLREPTDISKKLVGKPRDFKVLVQNCIEKKRKALELDIALRSQEENADHEIEQLQNLQREIELDWNDINEELTKTEEEDLANLLECLREENTTLKAEKDKAIQNNKGLREVIRDLESKVQEEEKEIYRLKRQLSEKESEVLLKEEEIESLNRQLWEKEMEVQLMKVENDRLKRQLSEKESEVQEKKKEIDSLKIQVQEKKKEIDSLKIQVQEKKKEIDSLKIQEVKADLNRIIANMEDIENEEEEPSSCRIS